MSCDLRDIFRAEQLCNGYVNKIWITTQKLGAIREGVLDSPSRALCSKTTAPVPWTFLPETSPEIIQFSKVPRSTITFASTTSFDSATDKNGSSILSTYDPAKTIAWCRILERVLQRLIVLKTSHRHSTGRC